MSGSMVITERKIVHADPDGVKNHRFQRSEGEAVTYKPSPATDTAAGRPEPIIPPLREERSLRCGPLHRITDGLTEQINLNYGGMNR